MPSALGLVVDSYNAGRAKKDKYPQIFSFFGICYIHNIIHQHWNLGAVLLDFPTDPKVLRHKLVKESDARVCKTVNMIMKG